MTKRMKTLWLGLFLAVFTTTLVACSEEDPQDGTTDVDSDSDTDSDADTDADSDTDSDTDTDTDSDTDTDTDSDTDSNMDSDTGMDTGTGTGIDTGTGTGADTGTGTGTDTGTGTGVDTGTGTGTDTGTGTGVDTGTGTGTDTGTGTGTDTGTGTGVDTGTGSAPTSPVEDIGHLSVVNGKVVGEDGTPANLRGMSYFWNIAPEARDYYNANVVNELADDWQANVVRSAMAVEDHWGTGQEGYEYEPTRNKNMMTTIVDAAIARGIYVIIDWHSHWSADTNNPQRQTLAIAFFEEMATAYGHLPNVIYEVYNEPGFGDDQWPQVKAYNVAVVNAIRAIDPDNLIIVGTTDYSSSVDVATGNPLTGVSNLAYAFHMYASDPNHDSYQAKADLALSRGYAVFVSEWGVSHAWGGGTLDYTRMANWLQWMTDNDLCWAAWSISNKDESSASLYTSASTAGNWTAGNLREAGTWYRDTLRSLNPSY